MQIFADNARDPNSDPRGPDWIEARLQQMEEDRLAGNFPENLEDILHRLGYPDYETYLRSALWREIRDRVMENHLWICERCGERAEEVHHRYYTEAVMRGDKDSLLVPLCAKCHNEVEFVRKGVHRTDEEKRRVLEDRDGVLQAKIETLRLKMFDEQTRDASAGRCYWCKGDTEIHPPWGSDGKTYVIPTERGDEVGVWMCSGCRSVLSQDKEGKKRSEEERLLILKRKANVRYNRHKPSTSFRPGNGFYRFNAMQREGLRNEYEWNCANIRRSEYQSPEETRRFTYLKQRYEETMANGR
jgi:hypothetical protein